MIRHTAQQEFTFFNGYYDSYCYQELLIHSEDGDLLWCELLSGKDDARKPALRALTPHCRAAAPGISAVGSGVASGMRVSLDLGCMTTAKTSISNMRSMAVPISLGRIELHHCSNAPNRFIEPVERPSRFRYSVNSRTRPSRGGNRAA
jgi:hypothetical protein